MQNQRSSLRTPLDAEISVIKDDTPLGAFRARNLSVGGAYLECGADALCVGDQVALQFPDNDAGIRQRKHAIVVHKDAAGAGLSWVDQDARFWMTMLQLLSVSLHTRNRHLAEDRRSSLLCNSTRR